MAVAEKRMFSKKIIDTDWFMDMPATTQNLYFHLSMRADDDGFVASPKRIVALIGASLDDYKLLVTKKFIIPFESGICVIKDWRVNNYLRNDRHTDTIYKEEFKRLTLNENGEYELGIPVGIPVVDPVYTISNSNSNSNNINNTSKEKEEKEKLEEPKHRYGEYQNVALKDSEVNTLNKTYGEDRAKEAIKYLDEYIEMKGYKAKSHYLAIRKWVFNAIKREEKEKNPQQTIDYSDMYTEEQLKRYRERG
jgi:hypothetical protein